MAVCLSLIHIFVPLTELQGDIEPHVLTHFEDDIATPVRESGSTHRQRVFAGRQARHLEQPLGVGHGLPGSRSCLGRYRDTSAGDGGQRRVLNSSTERSEVALRIRRCAGREKQ